MRSGNCNLLLIIEQKYLQIEGSQKDVMHTDAISALSDQLPQVVKEVGLLKQLRI